MAHYDHLPIYRDAMRLAVHIENTVRGFARYHKYTLGSELRNGSRRIMGILSGLIRCVCDARYLHDIPG